MAKKYVDIADLNDNHFVGVQSGNTVTVNLKLSPAAGNVLTADATGLKAIPPQSEILEYTLDGTNNVNQNNGNNGKKLRVASATRWGQIHLDFVYNVARPDTYGDIIYRLNSGTPTPKGLIEVMIDSVNGVTCWIDGGRRDIRIKGATRGRRYIIDLHGFFNN